MNGKQDNNNRNPGHIIRVQLGVIAIRLFSSKSNEFLGTDEIGSSVSTNVAVFVFSVFFFFCVFFFCPFFLVVRSSGGGGYNIGEKLPNIVERLKKEDADARTEELVGVPVAVRPATCCDAPLLA